MPLAGVLAAVVVSAAACRGAEPQDFDELRINQLQYIGTHNSYHVRKPTPGKKPGPWDYNHAPLDVQLEQGVRSFELDLHYKNGEFEVFHVPMVDEGTTCRRLSDALATVARWSRSHPRHVPISFLFELKKEGPGLDKRVKEVNPAGLDRLDTVLRAAFPPERLIAPDDVRGDAGTLREAVESGSWPKLSEARGKVLFILHDDGEKRALYTAGHPSLRGRAMFVRSDATRDDGATLVLDNPRSSDIPRLVKAGYFIRTRADSDLRGDVEARRARRDKALASGAQIVSTDFPPGEPDAETGYVVAFEDSAPARVNPVNGPEGLRGQPLAQSAESTPAEQLAALFAESWELGMREDPLGATHYGDSRYNDKLPRETLPDAERRVTAEREFLARLEAIDRESLSRENQINYDIFARLKRDAISEYEFRTHLMPITNRSGFHISFPELPLRVPLATVQDYNNYIARLRAFGQYADDNIALLRAGIEAGLTQPAVVLAEVDEVIKAHVVDDPTQSLLYKPFADFPEAIGEADRKRLAAEGKAAIAESVVPGYRRLLEFISGEYVPACRQQVGASALPQGREFYRYRLRHFTTLDVDPQQVHETGLAEVKRIKAEMKALIARVDFQGDFGEFVEFLRTDPRFYVDTPEQLLARTSVVMKRMDGELPRLFGKLPRSPYGIREIPDYIAPRTTTAYYMPPPGDGRLAGFYYVNTYNLKSRPTYEIEALSLHEAVPGHHIQIALQQELEGLPDFRRFVHATAFVEGWGLYAERLGLEVGFYQDPYSDFGRLSYEMWRACRLVVDTGMHYLGWTRQQAIDFMAENTALTLHNIAAEVDRYISWPGQATAYKMGELKIRALRQQAEKELGTKFDIRQFHDAVLASGAVPLDVLEDNVNVYIEQAAGD